MYIRQDVTANYPDSPLGKWIFRQVMVIKWYRKRQNQYKSLKFKV